MAFRCISGLLLITMVSTAFAYELEGISIIGEPPGSQVGTPASIRAEKHYWAPIQQGKSQYLMLYTRVKMGESLEDLKDEFYEVRFTVRKAQHVNPNRWEAYWLLGLIDELSEERSHAISYYKDALSRAPLEKHAEIQAKIDH
jgi:tetratricopeptide (TPR) repeat protein